MKFSDIDFDALSSVMNSLSDTDLDQLNSMAENMMSMMKPARSEEEEEDIDYIEGLKLSDEHQNLDEGTLSFLEQAWDLENFYDGQEADYSASVLFLQKALLSELRLQTENSSAMSLSDLLALESWKEMRNELLPVQSALYRAEYDAVSLEELQVIKDQVLALLLKVKDAA